MRRVEAGGSGGPGRVGYPPGVWRRKGLPRSVAMTLALDPGAE